MTNHPQGNGQPKPPEVKIETDKYTFTFPLRMQPDVTLDEAKQLITWLHTIIGIQFGILHPAVIGPAFELLNDNTKRHINYSEGQEIVVAIQLPPGS